MRVDSRNKRTGKPPARRKSSLGILFWIAFFIVVAGLFLVNRELIRQTVKDTRFMERVFGRPAGPSPAPEVLPEPDLPAPIPPAGTPLPSPDIPPAAPLPPVPSPGSETVLSPVPSPSPEPPPSAAPRSPAPQPPSRENLLDRSLYFTRIDNDGTVIRIKVTRQLPASDSPMMDVLGALLQGPGAEEQRRGYRSLIPPGSRVLSATVRGNTAYISFNEDFQYNSYGVEGYASQLKQVIWTVTEFSNVRDVQFLIEGKRIDYLGEGIWIGSPLARDSL